MKKVIFIFSISVGLFQLLFNENNSQISNKEISLNDLSFVNVSYAYDAGTGTCTADDPGECTATATCPGGGTSVCCVGSSPNCSSGSEAGKVWVECDNAGKTYVNSS